MAAEELPIEINSSQLTAALADAARRRKPIQVTANGAAYELDVRPIDGDDDEPLRDDDSLFDLIGAGSSSEPTDIAVHKHQYLADALGPQS